MDCVGIDPGNTFFWIVLSGLLFGGGFSFLAVPVRRRNANTALVFFSAAVIALLGGVILADVGRVLSSIIFIWLVASIILGYCCFLFWKALGIPLLFLSIIAVSLFYSAIFEWKCAVPDEEISRFTLISRNEEYIRIQYESAGTDSIQQRIDSSRVQLEIETLSLPYYFFLSPGRILYHIEGYNPEQPYDAGAGSLIFSVILRLPGFQYKIVKSEPLIPSPIINYIYSLNSKGEAVVERGVDA